MDEQRCGTCGGPVDAHDRQIRFRLPEPVLDSPGQERIPGAWLSHESLEASVMMQIPGVGPFVRALLVVRLTGGYAVTYGVWAGFIRVISSTFSARGGRRNTRISGWKARWPTRSLRGDCWQPRSPWR